MAKEITVAENYMVNDCLTLFDEQFSVDEFKSLVERTEDHSKHTLDSTREAVEKAFKKREADPKYVLDTDVTKSIERGDIQLVTSKTGEVYAQIRGEDGRFGKRLPIQRELEDEGISADELKLALQMEAIKEQLNALIEGMKDLESSVHDVIQGQRNDRIGLYYSGLSLYIEAKSVNDEYLKKQLIVQSLKSINDANAQVIQDIRSNIEYLMTQQYRNSKDRIKKIDEHLSAIQQCYEVVRRASFLKAFIYHDSNEITAMLTAIQEYGRFVEKLIIPYVGELNELDTSVRTFQKGSWQQIANTFNGCSEIRNQIENRNTFMLSAGGCE